MALELKKDEVLNGINKIEDHFTRQTFLRNYNLIIKNHNVDAEYDTQVNELLDNLKGSGIEGKRKRANDLKERKRDIQEYYYSEYTLQIFIVKTIVLFTLIALAGCALYQYSLMSSMLLMVYLGAVGAVAFVVIFYYLWDFYLRDTTIFDEYDFSKYISNYNSDSSNLYTPVEIDANLLSC